MNTINGQSIAQNIYDQIREDLKMLNRKLSLAIILASDDPASKAYTDIKMKRGADLGIETKLFRFDQTSTKDEIIKTIDELNRNTEITGILVQLPLFDHLKPYVSEIIDRVNPNKDADGLNALNLGMISHNAEKAILPAAVEAVMVCLEVACNLGPNWRKLLPGALIGKKVVIINNSNLVGKPLAMLLTSLNATVTTANKFTINLKHFTQEADIVISATNQSNVIDSTMIKEHSVLIDITSLSKDGKIYGDFIRDIELFKKADWITPVPGGVGPLTVACLFRNLIRLSIKK